MLIHYFLRNLHRTKTKLHQRCSCLQCDVYQEKWRLHYISLAMAEGPSSKALFPLKKRVKSAVWEHVGYTKNDQGVIQDDGSPVYKTCRKKVAAKGSNSSNLMQHLWDHHPALHAKVKLFSHCMLVTLACHMGDDFTPVLHAAMDKYLSAFAAVLAEKYR